MLSFQVTYFCLNVFIKSKFGIIFHFSDKSYLSILLPLIIRNQNRTTNIQPLVCHKSHITITLSQYHILIDRSPSPLCRLGNGWAGFDSFYHKCIVVRFTWCRISFSLDVLVASWRHTYGLMDLDDFQSWRVFFSCETYFTNSVISSDELRLCAVVAKKRIYSFI